jgi:hypothetical protein
MLLLKLTWQRNFKVRADTQLGVDLNSTIEAFYEFAADAQAQLGLTLGPNQRLAVAYSFNSLSVHADSFVHERKN